jgi:hypothetical protein
MLAGARRVVFALLASLALVLSAVLLVDCTSQKTVRPVTAAALPAPPRKSETNEAEEEARLAAKGIPYDDEWRSLGFKGGKYLAPKELPDPDSFDVIFHFHAGKFAQKEYCAESNGAVLVSLNYGAGTEPYAKAFNDPKRFGAMVDEVLALMRARTGNPKLVIHRTSLFAWSAGYASIGRILTQGYYDRIDTVVLLDGLHTNYLNKIPKRVIKLGLPYPHHVDVNGLGTFIRFAQDAAAGKKEFVFTHSSIVPPGYASTTETATELINIVKAQKVEEQVPAIRNLTRYYHADVGNFHIRGFTGTTKEAHIAHVHMVGDVLHDFVVPRWTNIDHRANASGTETASASNP